MSFSICHQNRLLLFTLFCCFLSFKGIAQEEGFNKEEWKDIVKKYDYGEIEYKPKPKIKKRKKGNTTELGDDSNNASSTDATQSTEEGTTQEASETENGQGGGEEEDLYYYYDDNGQKIYIDEEDLYYSEDGDFYMIDESGSGDPIYIEDENGEATNGSNYTPSSRQDYNEIREVPSNKKRIYREKAGSSNGEKGGTQPEQQGGDAQQASKPGQKKEKTGINEQGGFKLEKKEKPNEEKQEETEADNSQKDAESSTDTPPPPKPEIKDSPKPKPKPKKKNNTEVDSSIFMLLAIVIGAALLAFVFYQVLVLLGSRNKQKKKTSQNLIDEEDMDKINEEAKEKTLADLIQEHGVRRAFRMYYLIFIQSLQNQELIVWRKEKTNYDYYLELKKHQVYYADFADVTLIYERIWYGEKDFSSAEEQEKSLHLFENFMQILNQKRA